MALGRSRAASPAPDPIGAGAELAALRARVDQVEALCHEAMRRHAGNRDLVDFALDVRNTLKPQADPDVPVVPGPRP